MSDIIHGCCSLEACHPTSGEVPPPELAVAWAARGSKLDGSRLPRIMVEGIVTAQTRLPEHLRATHPRPVVGPSHGGFQTFEVDNDHGHPASGADADKRGPALRDLIRKREEAN